ncbi:MAG TPA: hypothetical protein VJ835_04540 [Fimbriimonadaceae bacterium]|nr:hypothetical protein [Fimbriimonadaceae bacterium]
MRSISISRAAKGAALLFTLFAFALVLAGDFPFKGSANGVATPVGMENGLVLLHTAASGNSTLLGGFSSAEDLTLDPATGQLAGTFVFTAANGATLFGTTAGQFVSPTDVVGTYTVTGGTGRLEGAAGVIDFSLTTSDGSHYTVNFSGLLTSH